MAKRSFGIKLNKPAQVRCPGCKNIFEVTEMVLAAEEDTIIEGEEIAVETLVRCPQCKTQLSGAGRARVRINPQKPRGPFN